jgi:hypothetical protein
MTLVSLSAGAFDEHLRLSIDSIIDADPFGDVVVIEILSPRQVEPRIDWARSAKLATLHVAYDDVADAVSVVVRHGTSSEQTLREVILHIDHSFVVRALSFRRV